MAASAAEDASRDDGRNSFKALALDVDEKQRALEQQQQQQRYHHDHGTIQTEKPFGTLSAIGVGYGVTNTAIGILLVVGSTVPFGGAPVFFWGFLLIIVVALATAISLAEFASAMPHPGGQYIWVNELAPSSSRRGLSFCTAVMSWLGAVATGASVCLSVSQGVCSIITFLSPDFVYQRWMGFVGFQLLNLLTMACASFEHALPRISTAVLLFSCASCFAVFVSLLSTSRHHPTPYNFFVNMVNQTGWPDGVSFLVAMSGINWSMACLDVATHLADEIPSPDVNVPKALMWTVVVGFVAGLLVIVAIFANVAGIDPAADNSALALFYRISGSQGLAVGLWVATLITTVGAVWSVQIWQSRLAWTIGRDGGFPLRKYLGRILPRPFYTPIWSLVGSAACSALFGCLYLASDVAFNSLISTGLVMQNLSYSIPIVLLLVRGRSRFHHGRFWLPLAGLLSNLAVLAWTLVSLVFYCLPYQLPVAPIDMNYVSVVLAIIAVSITALWFLFARNHYDVKYTRD